MTRTVDYLFSLASPWAYLGFDPFHAIAERHGLSIRYRPALLVEVFAETGGLPLAKRHPARQAYRLVELQRWRAHRAVPLVLKPRCLPLDIGLADRVALALLAEGIGPREYLRAIHRALWVEERPVGEASELRAILAAERLPERLIDAADAAPIHEAYAANRDWAIANGVFGAPSYVLDGEVFWGQDRLDFLAAMLESGREPYTPGSDR